GCNPTSSKFIHTWLRFGEIMRGSLSTVLVCHPQIAFLFLPGTEYARQNINNILICDHTLEYNS
ncbi:hypothetical protein, partial [Enterobacter hormaechei]